jgi:hypothetical protein
MTHQKSLASGEAPRLQPQRGPEFRVVFLPDHLEQLAAEPPKLRQTTPLFCLYFHGFG